ncbi:MAG: GNAT family N-acetyltransferase [Defluviitaleaceae bacterium]|nr:GNAT family N-acetyltransferase [Defluviitaleaceae bacterium]
MIFRESTKTDVPQIVAILNQGKEYLKNAGIDQWQTGYPEERDVLEDIENGVGYVLADGERVVATVAVIFDIEPTYNEIEGKWLSGDDNKNYCTIHRIAVDDNEKGSGKSALVLHSIQEICEKKSVNHIRVDTHYENAPMRRFLEKNGFVYCGTIYIPRAGKTPERAAYEKNVSDLKRTRGCLL